MIFVTGATGVLGARFLVEILNSTKENVIALIRAPDTQLGYAKLLKSIEPYDLQGRYRTIASLERVRIALGDITAPSLGMADGELHSLLAECTSLFHLAANTNLVGKMEDLQLENEFPMKTLIGACKHHSQITLNYVSSFSVVGDQIFNSSLSFSENDFDIGQKFRMMPYQNSKFNAEMMLRTSQIKWNIIRPGQIFGDSETGLYPEQHIRRSIFNDLLMTMIDFRLVPQSNWLFDMTPVEKVARGLVELCIEQNWKFETFHLVDPDPIRILDLDGLLKKIGIAARTSTFEGFLKSAHRSSRTPHSLRTLKFWVKGLRNNFDGRIQIDCAQTQSRLSFDLTNNHLELLKVYKYLFPKPLLPSEL